MVVLATLCVRIEHTRLGYTQTEQHVLSHTHVADFVAGTIPFRPVLGKEVGDALARRATDAVASNDANASFHVRSKPLHALSLPSSKPCTLTACVNRGSMISNTTVFAKNFWLSSKRQIASFVSPVRLPSSGSPKIPPVKS